MAAIVRLAPRAAGRRCAAAAPLAAFGRGRVSFGPAAAVPHCVRWHSDAADQAAGPSVPPPPQPDGLWGRFVRWSYKVLGDTFFPEKATICNCGVDMGMILPRPDLVVHEGIEHGSREWRMQMYGAAMYLHLMTTPGEKLREADMDWIKGKDVLEVACMRGGGARYLTEVLRPRRYLATDGVEKNVERCKQLFPDVKGLEFQRVDAMLLPQTFPAESFDFVLCVQAATQFQDITHFIRGATYVLRPGGRIILADAFSRDMLQAVMQVLEAQSLTIDAMSDLSRAVHAVGLCTVPAGKSYLRIVARKDDAPVQD